MVSLGRHMLPALFLCPRWEPPIAGSSLSIPELLMFPMLKHAFSSLAWYAKQDAEAWKLLSFLVCVLVASVAIASVSH